MFNNMSTTINYERDKDGERISLRRWCSRLHAKKIGLFLCILGYAWALTLFAVTINNEDQSVVQPNPQETHNRKTLGMMSTLLSQMNNIANEINKTNQDLMKKIKRVEEQLEVEKKRGKDNSDLSSKLDKQEQKLERVSNIVKGQDGALSTKLSHTKSEGTSSDCEPSGAEAKIYTDCKEKMTFIEQNWHNKECYKEHGVDGSRCSIRKYLSEVEPFCPLMKNSNKMSFEFQVTKPPDEQRSPTKTNPQLNDLISVLTAHGPKKKYDWMEKRISSIWDGWADAFQKLKLPPRKQKKVLVYLGLLSNTPGAKFFNVVKKGGPLGELVQWSDIIATLFLLGHDITVISDVSDMLNFLGNSQFLHLPCKKSENNKFFVDLIFTDIFGFKQMEERLDKKVFEAHRCVFRLVDSFGTEPKFNWKSYAKSLNIDKFFGSCNVQPRQFFTLFPHSPDNSFMGFVIKQSEFVAHNITKKKNQVLVYGKQPDMWKGTKDYINVIHSMGLEVHGTVYAGSKGQHKVTGNKIPPYVHNHGLLNTPEVRGILKDSKIFVGQGFPYEGPAPLEALAEGCVFFNAKLDPPHNGLNAKFFESKPTHRKLTSQVPYLESIGPPQVLTININDVQQVKKAVNDALAAINSGKISRFIPKEFTQLGMLERVNAYLENQDFCQKPMIVWPPLSEGRVFVSRVGASCVETCRVNDLICEPAYFPSVNNVQSLTKYFKNNCSSTGSGVHHLYPARNTQHNTCLMQNEAMLFSCAGEDAQLQRLCPCRTYIKHQSALCRNCL